jgi:hypothetical protein
MILIRFQSTPIFTALLTKKGLFSLGVKRLGHEADHLPPPNAEVKNAWVYLHSSKTPSCRGAQFKTSQGLNLMLMLSSHIFGI